MGTVKIEKIERMGKPAIAVFVDGVQVGRVWKSVRETHQYGRSGRLSYSTGVTRRQCWMADMPKERGLHNYDWRTRGDAIEFVVAMAAKAAKA